MVWSKVKGYAIGAEFQQHVHVLLILKHAIQLANIAVLDRLVQMYFRNHLE